MSLTRVIKVYPTCMLFTPINVNEDGKSGWCEFVIFRSNPWCQFIELLEICCKVTNIHESVENKISSFWLHKAQNVRACHIYGHNIFGILKKNRLDRVSEIYLFQISGQVSLCYSNFVYLLDYMPLHMLMALLAFYVLLSIQFILFFLNKPNFLF